MASLCWQLVASHQEDQLPRPLVQVVVVGVGVVEGGGGGGAARKVVVAVGEGGRTLSTPLLRLLVRMLSPSPAERATMEEVAGDAWILAGPSAPVDAVPALAGAVGTGAPAGSPESRPVPKEVQGCRPGGGDGDCVAGGVHTVDLGHVEAEAM